MASRLVHDEISSDYVVSSSLLIAMLSRHYEQLLNHSTIVLWCAIIASCLSAVGLAAFVFLALTDPTGVSATLLTLVLRFGLPVSFSGGLFWLYDRLQRRAMEVALQLSKERRLDSARSASDSIEDPQARDAIHGRMAEHLVTRPEEPSIKLALGHAK